MRRPSAAEVRLARAWLSRAVEPGRGAVFDLVTEVGPVEAARLLRSGSAGGAVAALAEARRREDRAADDLAAAARIGARLVTPEDDEWPDAATWAMQIAYARERAQRLAGQPAHDRVELAPPLSLWVLGAARLDEVLARSVSIVGSRSATPYGEHVAADLAHGLALRRWTVTSGGAFGIDGAAHRGALSVDGMTLAVLACGVDQPYPVVHATLLDRIAASGLVVSEYPPGSVPARHRFLVRNRLIAALGAGTLVVEAGLRSGAHRTAADARALGRPVMAVPGPVTSGPSAGCHHLIRHGAELVTRPEEVLEAVGRLGLDLATDPATPTRSTDALDGPTALVHDALPARGSRDSRWLAREAGVPPDGVRAALTELERRGLARQRDGLWQLARRTAGG